MKKTIAITAAILTVGFIGIQVASAAPGWHRGYGQHAVYTGRHMGPGPGYMHRAINADTTPRYGRGPDYCLTDYRPHRGAGPQHRPGYGYGPMHWDGHRW